VAVGRLDFQKNYELMFDAFQSFLIKQHVTEDYRLLIIGDGPLKDQLIKSVIKRKLDRQVKFMGFLSNPFPYIKNADALIMTSRWEGLPTVIIEALTLGTQVISTDCPTGPRELLQNGEYGHLCRVNDIDCLSENISKIYKGEKKEVPSGFLNQFYIENSTKEYMKLITC
jgi:glycosyltransferase involved in cell wall biosynthesis